MDSPALEARRREIEEDDQEVLAMFRTLAKAFRSARQSAANYENAQRSCAGQSREKNNAGRSEIDPSETRDFQTRLGQIQASDKAEQIDLRPLDSADFRAKNS